MHPYLRATISFVFALLLAGLTAFLGYLAVPEIKEGRDAAALARITQFVTGTLTLVCLLDAATCTVYGTVRSLRRADERKAGRSRPAEQPHRAPETFQRFEPVPAQTELAPISIEPEPAPAAAPGKPVRLVMREPSGKVVGLPLRDPAKIDHYRAKYEQRGYRFLRTEPL